MEQPFIVYASGMKIERIHCIVPGCPYVTVKRKLLRGLGKTEHYAELVLEMQEPTGLRSKHECGICKRCLRRLWQHGPMQDELTTIWARDVAQMVTTALRAGHRPELVQRLAARQRARLPMAVLHERGRGDR